MIRDPSCPVLRDEAYRLLAACFYPPPEPFEERCLPALADLLEDPAPEAARHARDAAYAGEQAPLDSLAVEHARLFIGPFHLVAPPYGSLYLDDAKTVMGESTGKVSAFYASCGLHLADDFHEMPDHIAAELEFLSFLAHSNCRPRRRGSTKRRARAVNYAANSARTARYGSTLKAGPPEGACRRSPIPLPICIPGLPSVECSLLNIHIRIYSLK